MKIYANIDDLAIIIKDVLSDDLFKKVCKYEYSSENKVSSMDSWKEHMYQDLQKNKTMNPVGVVNHLATYENGKFTKSNKIFKEVLDIIINCDWIPFQKNSDLNLNYYEYNKHAGINWHTDGYTLNYSLYIHEEWDHNWGGETLLDTGRGLPLAVSPLPNSLLVIKNNVFHKVCPVIGPEKRKVLQMRGKFLNQE